MNRYLVPLMMQGGKLTTEIKAYIRVKIAAIKEVTTDIRASKIALALTGK